MTDIASHERLANWTAAARVTVARRDVRLAGRVLAMAVVALVALNSKSLFSRLASIGHPDPT